MITANTSTFRKKLYTTLEQVVKYNQIAKINTKDGDAVIMSADDYKNIMETMYISSHSQLKADLLEAKKAPDSDFIPADEVKW